jgi:hypothetical protein
MDSGHSGGVRYGEGVRDSGWLDSSRMRSSLEDGRLSDSELMYPRRLNLRILGDATGIGSAMAICGVAGLDKWCNWLARRISSGVDVGVCGFTAWSIEGL